MDNKLPRLMLALCASLSFSNSLWSDTWDSGAASNLWNDAPNWGTDVVPNITDSAWANTTGDFVKVDSSVSAEAYQLIVARSGGVTGVTLDMNGGTLTTANVIFVGQYAGAIGNLIMSDGTIASGTELAIGVSGEGNLSMTGGSISVASNFKIGRYNQASAVGHVDLHGGTIDCLNFEINPYSSMDVANNALLIIDGNESSRVNGYITSGQLTAGGGTGTVSVDYDITHSGKTTVTSSATVTSKASSPVPENGATDINLDDDLSWTAGQGVSFDVYMGLIQSDVELATTASSEYLGASSIASFDPGTLLRGYTYYWRVDEKDSSGQVITPGDVWSFEADSFDLFDLGDTTVTYDFTDVRAVSSAPAVGVHPRLFFNASEIPDILNRLQTTASGQAVSAQINAYMTLMDLGYANYNQNASYALDASGRRYIDNGGLYDTKAYLDDLIAGNADPLAGSDSTKRILLSGQLALRAFWSLVNGDQTDLADVGTMLANLAPELDVYGDDYQCFVHLAYAYDFAYNGMSTAERDTVRAEIVDHLNGHVPYGTYEEAYAATSNWVGLTSFWQLAYMAVEGEDPNLETLPYEGGVRAYYNFLTYGWYPSGAGWEGLGKNYTFATSLIAFARRGESYLGHPHLRAYAEDFLPALMQPFGYAFTAYDSLGGTGRKPDPINEGYYRFNEHDAIGLKWIYPNSPEVDFLWRNYVGDDYDYRGFSPRGYDNPLLMAAIFCSDYTDTSAWDSSVFPLSYFAGDRGLMHTRSDTTQDAMSLQFHARQDFGGHTNADRLNFNMSALGRAWAVYRTEVNGGATGNPHEMKYHSNVLIDDTGILVNNKDGVKARQPSKILSYTDGSDITTVTGDATYAYAWEYDWSAAVRGTADSRLSDGWIAVQETLNDFRYTPGTETYHDIPFYEYASWTGYPLDERMAKRANLAVDHVYRTASLIRGDEPYVLIVDDIAMTDGQSHNYKWQMQLVDDLTIESTDVNLVDSDYRCDIILKEPAAAGGRRLLVRVLQNDGYMGTPGYILNRIEPRNEVENWPALVVEATTAASPNFKVMLYAYHDGDPLPVTSWNGSDLSVSFNGQVDAYTFSQSNGLTNYTHQRSSSDITAPDAPLGLVATADDNQVDLDWGDNSEPDLDGYTVYRSTASGSNYTVLASNVTVSDYSDATAINDTVYYYVVTASDTNGNESAYSTEVVANPQRSSITAHWDNGAVDARWASPTNWNPDYTPRNVDDIWINAVNDYVLIEQGDVAEGQHIIIARHAGCTGIVTEMTGGSLSTGGVLFLGQYADAHGTLRMSGGTVSVGTEMAVGVTAQGLLEITAGSIDVTTAFKVGRYNVATAIGHVDLHGGVINCASFAINSYSSMDVETGTLIIDGDKANLLNTYITNGLITGYGGAGTLNVNYNVTHPGQTTLTATDPVPAYTGQWDNGASDSLWVSDVNWQSDSAPRVIDDIWMNSANDYALIASGDVALGKDIIIARHASATGVITEMTGGSLTTSGVVFIGQYGGSDGTMILSGGTLSTGTEMAVSVSGAGQLEMTGGVINVSTAFKVGRYEKTTAIGHVDLHGGTIHCSSFAINSYSSMDVEAGILVIDGNKLSAINSYVTDGRITAYGGAGSISVDYDVSNVGKTTVTAVPAP